jgi:DNA topoisomerase-3
MICARYLENKNFVPQTYYQVSIQPDKDGQVFKAISEKNFKTREEAQAVLDLVEPTGHILSVEAKPRKEPPPLLHDLSSLQQEANKRKGFTADQTLHCYKPFTKTNWLPTRVPAAAILAMMYSRKYRH